MTLHNSYSHLWTPPPFWNIPRKNRRQKKKWWRACENEKTLSLTKWILVYFSTEYFRYDGKMSIDTLPVNRLTKAVIVVAMATNWKLLSSGYHQMLSVICNLLRQYFFANATKRMSIIPYFSVVPSPSSGRFKWNLIAEKFHASKLKGHKFKWASI